MRDSFFAKSFAKITALTLISLIPACTAAVSEDASDTEQPVYGGTLVPNNNLPQGAVIKIIYPFTTIEQCSGVKIGANRFYTAAHCTQNWGPGQTIFISNLIDPGQSITAPNWIEVTLANVFVHPSYAADPLRFQKTTSTEHSYDVAIFDINEQTQGISAVSSVQTTHVADNLGFFSVGYGIDPVTPANAGKKQTGSFTTLGVAGTTITAARYAHQLIAVGAQGNDSGDSGGAAFLSSSNALIGLVQNGTAGKTVTTPKKASGFARIANVSRWLAAPHNGSLTTFSGIGFLEQGFQHCAVGGSLTLGQKVGFGECEGYDPSIHAQLWQMVPVSGTSFFQVRTARSGVNRCFDLSGSDVVLQTCNSARKEQQWKATPVGTDGLFNLIVNQKDPAHGVLADSLGGETLQIGTSTIGNDKKWLFYR